MAMRSTFLVPEGLFEPAIAILLLCNVIGLVVIQLLFAVHHTLGSLTNFFVQTC